MNRSRWWPYAPFLMSVDVVTVLVSFGVSLWFRSTVLPALGLTAPFAPVRSYSSLWPVLPLLLMVRSSFGLYPGYGMATSAELRLQTVSTVLLATFVIAGGALFRFADDYSRIVLASTAMCMVFLLPVTRAWAKWFSSRRNDYGITVPAVSSTDVDEIDVRTLAHIRHALARRPAHGIRLADEVETTMSAQVRAQRRHVLYLEGSSPLETDEALDRLASTFESVWFVPRAMSLSAEWIEPRDLGGILALEVRNRLLSRGNALVKRTVDVVLVVAALPVLIPTAVIVAISVKITSRGPIFVKQIRVGKGGNAITIRKFRSMIVDAEERLRDILQEDSCAREEWQAHQKLRHDPRVTQVGRWLRRTSLDELPQLWNVLAGTMSLVGPRPVLSSELGRYGDKAIRYLSVTPGMTGLTQISGRSDLDYAERIRLDTYYVRNWSIWLDFEILARSIGAVVSGRGAY